MGKIILYHSDMFPKWTGSALLSGLGSKTRSRVIVTGATAKGAERWDAGFRVRDVEVEPDGAVWMLEDGSAGGVFHVTPN